MIPKTIHYCWFGRNSLPESALKCIDSWKKYLPDYEIKEWNEDNFDVNISQYTKEAYEAKKYAFVSDYARFWILYNYGGLYFDTDVEVIKPLNTIVEAGPFMGIERESLLGNCNDCLYMVNPGLGLGASAGLKQYSEIIEHYNKITFFDEKGVFIPLTVVHHTTSLLEQYGFNNRNEMQKCGEITIYPSDFFCPMDSTTGILEVTNNTVSIHHYSCSWINHKTLRFKLHLLKMYLIRYTGKIGIRLFSRL